MFKKNFFILILGLCCFLNQLAQAEKHEKFKLGIIAPLSGGLAEYGQALLNGIRLAELNENKVLSSVEIYFEDHVYSNYKALAAFHKLRNQNKVDLIFIWGSGPSEAVAPVSERVKFPLITLGDHTCAVNKNYVINFTNPASQYSKQLLKALRKANYKKFSIVLSDINYLRTLTDAFQEELKKDEGLNIIDTLDPSAADFKTTIAKLKRENTDAVGVFLLSGQISKFYRQMAEQKLKLPSFGTDFFESTTEITASGKAINGAIYAHNIVTNDFRKNYINKYKNDIQLPTAARGYDLVMLIANQVNLQLKSNLESNLGLKLLKNFEFISNQSGVSGSYSFVNTFENGKYFHFPIVAKKIQNGLITQVSVSKKNLQLCNKSQF